MQVPRSHSRIAASAGQMANGLDSSSFGKHAPLVTSIRIHLGWDARLLRHICAPCAACCREP